MLLICGWALDASAQNASASMSPNPVDVGTLILGDSPVTGMATGTLSANRNVTVRLVIGNCSGPNGTFTLSPNEGIQLNQPKQITVSYTTSQAGTRQCSVSVRDGNRTIGSFYIRGTARAPQAMSISGSADFGSVRWNDAAPTHTVSRNFTVTNTGGMPLTVSSVTVTGDFAITSGTTPATIQPNNARTWTVTFNPNAPGGAKSGTLTFTSDAPKDGTQTIALTGTATNAVIGVDDRNFGIVNIGSSDSEDITVTNTGGNPKGPLGLTGATITGGNGWFTFSGCGGGTTCTWSPARLINTSDVVSVKCTPPATANANDMQTATVTFTSDTDDASDTTSTLTCVAGRSTLATNMATVTFPPHLVGTTSTPTSFTVTNTGNIDATFYLMRTGAHEGSFSATTTTGCGTDQGNLCTLAPNDSATINITVTPQQEGDISAGLELVSNATPSPTLTLTARGIDRHIQVIESLQFPDTFRNPGDMATVMPVTVQNVGEYPLTVMDIVLDGEPNWQLAAEQPRSFEVPGLASRDVLVAFTPVTAGKAPDATLSVLSDDRTNGLVSVVLSGNGKDRNVAMGPGALDFGNTGAGVPITYSSVKPSKEEWLTIINEDEHEFVIREITFDPPGVFRVETFDGGEVRNVALPTGERRQFELVFAPPEVGEYTANMTLYLDQDPLGQRTVQVTGRALFVDARGGGGFGCSTGSGAGSGVLFALLALRRRKRTRA